MVDAINAVNAINAVGPALGFRLNPSMARTAIRPVNAAQPVEGMDNSESEQSGAPVQQKKNDQNSTTPYSQVEQKQKQQEQGSSTAGATAGQELTEEQQTEVQQLKSRDREVRAHEQSHMAAGGNLVTRGAMYSYKTGPDGERYAVGGEVEIDTSPVRDNPQATIAKAARIIRAALAPAEPSQQDRSVAAAAGSMQFNAQVELARQAYQKTGSTATAAAATPAFNLAG